MQVEKGLVKMRDRGELSRDASPADIALAVLTALQGGLLLSKGEKSNRPLEVAFEMALAYVGRTIHGQPANASQFGPAEVEKERS